MADYLYRESLLQLPETTRRFLRRTAVLDQLSAPLCDAVVGAPGAQEQLRSLEASSLFLVPLDRRREWYRYHALFREFLLGELRRVEPDIIAKLHLRAADWYEANGSPALALEHLLNTTERDRCTQLVTALVLPTYQVGQMSTVQRWLSTLGDHGHRGLSPPRRPGRLGRGVDRAARRSTTLVGDPRHHLPRPGASGWLGVVRVGAGDVAVHDVPRRARAGPDRCHASAWPRSRRGARGATKPSPSAPRRICSPATPSRPPRSSRSRPPLPPRTAIPMCSSTAGPLWHCWPWIGGDGRRRRSMWTGYSAPSMNIGCTTTR